MGSWDDIVGSVGDAVEDAGEWVEEGYNELTGQDDAKKAKKANEKNLKANLFEIDQLLPMLQGLYDQAQSEMRGGFEGARKTMGGYLDTGAAKYDQALIEIQQGQDAASQGLDAQAGAAQQAAFQAQSQALAGSQQSMMGRGLAGTSVGTAAGRGIGADTARSLGGTFANIGAQKANLAMQGGQARAGILQNSAGFQMQAGQMMGGLDVQQGVGLSNLLTQLAGAQQNVGALKASTRAGVQHVPGTTPLENIAAVAKIYRGDDD